MQQPPEDQEEEEPEEAELPPVAMPDENSEFISEFPPPDPDAQGAKRPEPATRNPSTLTAGKKVLCCVALLFPNSDLPQYCYSALACVVLWIGVLYWKTGLKNQLNEPKQCQLWSKNVAAD